MKPFLIAVTTLLFVIVSSVQDMRGQCPPGYFSGEIIKTLSTTPQCILRIKFCTKVLSVTTPVTVEILITSVQLTAETGSPCLNSTLDALVESNLADVAKEAYEVLDREIPQCPTPAITRISLGGCRTDEIVQTYLELNPNGPPTSMTMRWQVTCDPTFKCFQNYAYCQSVTNGYILQKVGSPYTEGTPCVGATYTYNGISPYSPPDGQNDITVPCNPVNCP